MLNTRWIMTLALLPALLLVGCGGGGEEAAAPSTTTTASAPAPAAAGNGTIAGTATYANGDPDKAIKMDADPVCADMHTEAVHTESVVTDEAGHLANVFVFVSGGLEGKTFQAPGDAHLLDQSGCLYKPHVSGVMVGQKLIIRNSDQTLHNVHALPTKNKEFNQGQPFKDMELEHKFDHAEVMVRFKCDVHPWMGSYMGVLEHPFFAVTGADGGYSIEGLPAGTYTVETWHEELGSQTQEVTVADNATAQADFAFEGGADAAAAGL